MAPERGPQNLTKTNPGSTHRMNQKTTYEVILTEKLQQLPLPDMEDAIWARVRAQLDLDMPADDTSDPTPDAPSGGGWYWSAGSFIFLAALIASFLLTKKTENPPAAGTAAPVPTTPAMQENSKADSQQAAPVLNPLPPPGLQTGNPPDSPVRAGIASPVSDSIALQPTLRLPQADSLQQTTLVLPSPVRRDTLPPKKRQRGVGGITDNDYRIVPAKKDSL